MEMSKDMFERIVGMLAENRTAIQTAELALTVRMDGLGKELSEILKNQLLQQSSLEAIEEDLGEIQKEVRSVNIVLGRHDEAFDGLTQLTKTNFNMTESVLKHIHGEAGEIGHGEEEQREEAEGDRRG